MKTKGNIIERILWFLAGAESDVLVKHTKSRNNYTWLGLLVFFPAIIALCLWGWGVYASTGSLVKATLAGMVGFIIITFVESTLVRIVAKIPGQKPTAWENLGLYIKRGLLSLLLATLSLAPLHHIMFGKQIAIAKMNQQINEVADKKERWSEYHGISSLKDKIGLYKNEAGELEHKLHNDSVPAGFNDYGTKRNQFNDARKELQELEIEKKALYKKRISIWAKIPTVEKAVKDENSSAWKYWNKQKHNGVATRIADSLYALIPVVNKKFVDNTTTEYRNYLVTDGEFRNINKTISTKQQLLDGLTDEMEQIRKEYFGNIQINIAYNDSVATTISDSITSSEGKIEQQVNDYRSNLESKEGFADDFIMLFAVLADDRGALVVFLFWTVVLLLLDLFPLTYKVKMPICAYAKEMYYNDKSAQDSIEKEYYYNSQVTNNIIKNNSQLKEQVLKQEAATHYQFWSKKRLDDLNRNLRTQYKTIRDGLPDFIKKRMNGHAKHKTT